MCIERWNPKQALSRQEERFLRRMGRVGKLFAFLRRHSHELISDAFQVELEGMYRATGAGKAPVPPGLMAMAAGPTILGLLPMALGVLIDFSKRAVTSGATDAQFFWRPMAVAVIFGLTVATLLTLVMVPTL